MINPSILVEILKNTALIQHLANIAVIVGLIVAFLEYKNNQKRAKEEDRPYVILELLPYPKDGSILNLSIKNIGKSLAKNVKIHFNPNKEYFNTGKKFNELNIFNLPYLPPR